MNIINKICLAIIATLAIICSSARAADGGPIVWGADGFPVNISFRKDALRTYYFEQLTHGYQGISGANVVSRPNEQRYVDVDGEGGEEITSALDSTELLFRVSEPDNEPQIRLYRSLSTKVGDRQYTIFNGQRDLKAVYSPQRDLYGIEDWSIEVWFAGGRLPIRLPGIDSIRFAPRDVNGNVGDQQSFWREGRSEEGVFFLPVYELPEFGQVYLGKWDENTGTLTERSYDLATGDQIPEVEIGGKSKTLMDGLAVYRDTHLAAPGQDLVLWVSTDQWMDVPTAVSLIVTERRRVFIGHAAVDRQGNTVGLASHGNIRVAGEIQSKSIERSPEAGAIGFGDLSPGKYYFTFEFPNHFRPRPANPPGGGGVGVAAQP